VNYWLLNCVSMCVCVFVCVCVCVCVCVVVEIKKEHWGLRGNVKYSCKTDSRLADSNTSGCSRTAVVATEVTLNEGMCVRCVYV